MPMINDVLVFNLKLIFFTVSTRWLFLFYKLKYLKKLNNNYQNMLKSKSFVFYAQNKKYKDKYQDFD